MSKIQNAMFAQFATSTDKEVNGVMLEYGQNSKGKPIRVLIARAGGANKKYSRMMAEEGKPYRRLLESGNADPEVLEGLVRKCHAHTVVLGWENMEDLECNDLECTPDNIEKMFKLLPEWYADVVNQASRIDLFRQGSLDLDAKN